MVSEAGVWPEALPALQQHLESVERLACMWAGPGSRVQAGSGGSGRQNCEELCSTLRPPLGILTTPLPTLFP